jgi:serine/threonine-protein kinase HipA
MSLPDIRYCPSSLQPGFNTYSPAAQLALFGARSKKVSHVLVLGPPGKNAELTREYNEKRKSISISGVQEKYSLALEKNTLNLTATKGTHILKPVPSERLELVNDMPANEHVSMQIAKQVYKINTAACGMIFFDDGSPAYITRRFDYKGDGSKYQVEDFATLLGKSPEKEGDDYKYNASYLDIAQLIHKYAPAATITLLHYFRLLVFNYLIANGDAHLKNFALLESVQGDYILAPAYDLMCTALHINDTNLALRDGLYEGDTEEASYLNFGTYNRQSFLVFAEKAGIAASFAEKIIDELVEGTLDAIELIERSFLSTEGKRKYIETLGERRRRLLLK